VSATMPNNLMMRFVPQRILQLLMDLTNLNRRP
jgi:hypothetical protein